VTRFSASRFADVDDPAVRQLASVAGVLLALMAVAFIPGVLVFDPVWMWVGAGGTLALLACRFVPWSRLRPEWAIVVPVLSLVFIGLFRVGTGGSYSMFASLLIIPIVWIASMPGRQYVIVAMVATFSVMSLPYLLGTEQLQNGQLLRVIFSTLVFGLVGVVVNELSRRSRTRLARTQSLAHERASLLEDATITQLSLARTAEELRASQAFFGSVWEATVHEMVVVTELDGEIVAWGPGAEAMLGHEAASMQFARSIYDVIAVDDVDLRRRLDALLSAEGGDAVIDDISLLHASGERVPVRLSCAPRLGADGSVVGRIFVALDMTAERDAARVKDEFVGMISHELRTPLSSILGYLELVRDEEGLSDDQGRYLDVVERNANRLLELVGDLLFVAQVDAGRIPIEVGDVDLTAVAAASAESIMPVAERGGVTVSVELPEAPVVVRGDRGRIAQALDNLVSNAVKFTRPEGSVRISVGVTDDEAVLAVADTGIGISADEMEQLFTRFFRSRTATREAIRGVGLGLNITKAIVTAHRGTLSASSIEGEGTVFEIRLPVGDGA